MSDIDFARRQFRAAADRTPPPLPPAGYRGSMANFDRLRSRGLVVWAALVRTNQAVFTRNGGDVFATVVWSEEPAFDGKPEELRGVAKAVFALKDTTPADKELLALAETVSQKVGVVARSKVPAQLTGGRKVWLTTVYVNRSCLPGGVLTDPTFPILIDPLEHGNSVVLPAEFWPPELAAKWQAAAATAPRAEDVPGVKEATLFRIQFLTQARAKAERGEFLRVTPAAATEVRRRVGGTPVALRVRYASYKGDFRHECELVDKPMPCVLATASEGVQVQVPDEYSAFYSDGIVIDYVRKGADGEFTVQAPPAAPAAPGRPA